MTNRQISFAGFAICAALILAALYFQYYEELDPCPLCVFQRLAFIAMGVAFLLWFLHNPSGLGRRIYGLLTALFGLVGAAIAARHVWLQNLSEDQVPECGPGLDYMLEVMPFKKLLETVFKGSGECADVLWTLFGISMPGWSLIWLLLLSSLAFFTAFRRE